MKKIAVIHDLSGMGKCSLTAAIPVISAMGVQACPLPTAVLSNQTGYGSYFWDDYTDHMEEIMKEWKKMDFKPDGVYTGFLAGARQVDVILKFVEMFCTKETHILIDPVMGDQGNVYRTYSEELCEKMRTLVQQATVITPNLTEALPSPAWRTGNERTDGGIFPYGRVTGAERNRAAWKRTGTPFQTGVDCDYRSGCSV